MTKIFDHKIKPDHYTADACVFWCFDNRFQSLVGMVMAHYKFRDVDEVKIAGGARDLVHGNSFERRYLLGQIEKSVKLHHTPEVILMVHHACGAYGKTFNNSEEELAFYSKELDLAKAVVLRFAKAKKLKLRVKKVFASFDGLVELE